jgi:hypothetical protein
MRSGTIGGMKVLAVKDVEEYSNLWTVPYTYLRADGGKRNGRFSYRTPDEAHAKRDELLDILQHHDGVYLGNKAKKRLRAGNNVRMRIGDTVKVINRHVPRYGEVGKVVSKEQTPTGRLWRVKFADNDGLYHQETLKIVTAS